MTKIITETLQFAQAEKPLKNSCSFITFRIYTFKF